MKGFVIDMKRSAYVSNEGWLQMDTGDNLDTLMKDALCELNLNDLTSRQVHIHMVFECEEPETTVSYLGLEDEENA